MTTVLSRRGYNILKDGLNDKTLESIKKELTVAPFVPEDFAMIRPVPFKLYQESSTRLYVPKYYGLKKWGAPDVNKLPSGQDINLEFKGTLRDYQYDPIKKYLDAAHKDNVMGGLLNLYCGGGKTTMAIYIICQLKKKALIVCHKDFLLQQWKERIEQFAPTARIGLVKAKTIDVKDKDIVLASLQSISMKDYDDDVFADIGTVCFDEVHHLGAEVFSQALRKLTVQYSLGLSATMKRKDGLTKVFQWYLGDIVFKAIKRPDELEVHMCDFYDPNPKYSLEIHGARKTLMIPRMINNICAYQPRIDYIVGLIQNVLAKEPDRKIIILSDRLNHLNLLHTNLRTAGFSSAFYIGGMKQEHLKESEDSPIILATYHIAAEGFDCPGLDTLILASPKSDVIQCIGRIQRTPQHLRTHKPLVLDIVDNFSMFSGQSRKRYKYYKSCKYDIVGSDIFECGTNSKIELKGECFITDIDA